MKDLAVGIRITEYGRFFGHFPKNVYASESLFFKNGRRFATVRTIENRLGVIPKLG